MKARYILRNDGKNKWGCYDRLNGKFVGKLTTDRIHALNRVNEKNLKRSRT